MAQVEIEIVGRDSASGALGNIGSIITGIESAIRLAGEAFSFFWDKAQAGLDAVAFFERLELSLTTLTAAQMVMAGAAEDVAAAWDVASIEAEALLDWIQELAINSPFTTEGVANAFRIAQAYGFTADEAMRLTEAMINFAAGTGASEDAMARIALALGQIEAKGRLSGQEVLQLVNAGLPVTQILAEAFGVTTAELEKMREDGLIPAQDAIEAITVYLETNFAGAAQRQATSWAGLRSTFQDIMQIGLREFFRDMYEALQPLAVELSLFLQTEGMDRLREWGEILGAVAAGFAGIITDGNLYELGYQLQQLGGTDSFFYALGTAIRVFQQALDNDEGFWASFQEGLQKFLSLSNANLDPSALLTWADNIFTDMINAITNRVVLWNAEGGAGNLIAALISWIDDIATGPEFESKIGAAANNLLTAFVDAVNGFTESDLQNLTNSIDGAVSRSLDRINWSESGDAFGDAIERLFGIGIENAMDGEGGTAWYDHLPFVVGIKFIAGLLSSSSISSLANGISDWFLAAMNLQSWSEFFPRLMTLYDYGVELGENIGDGLREGIRNSWFGQADQWVYDHIILPVKRALGIASPSTVFMEIGRNIVLGIWEGMSQIWNSFTTWVAQKFSNLLDNLSWENIVAVLTGQMSIADLFGSTGGSIGGGVNTGPGGTLPPTTTGGGGVLTGGTIINQYFYGNVYVGAIDELLYDCAQTNPLLQAGASTVSIMP